MELPITKPSQVSYADELELSELLEKLMEKEHNGFIRVTHGSEEGYILFKYGIQVAASYDLHLKHDALEKINFVMKKTDTLIEVFDLKKTQIDYLIDLNKVYKFDLTKKSNKTTEKPSEMIKNPSEDEYFNPKMASYREPLSNGYTAEKADDQSEVKTTPETNSVDINRDIEENNSIKSDSSVEESTENNNDDLKPIESTSKIKTSVPNQNNGDVGVNLDSKTVPNLKNETSKAKATEKSTEIENSEKPIKSEDDSSQISPGKEITSEEELILEEEPPEPQIPMDRADLMKKYGLKDIEDEEVDKVIETYKGGEVSIEDLEKIELTLMNKIKKSVMGINKIGGTEVMVFLDNTNELSGKINIICEYASKGIFSRIMGDSKDIQNLKFHISEIVEMEIRKSFREYPQIVDNFEINIDIN
ncbi:MAG: hypothetical protein KKH76_00175 [Euryarchaeota archaeon]|nr:hypothetical protein [Euryarchaeota archaeon]